MTKLDLTQSTIFLKSLGYELKDDAVWTDTAIMEEAETMLQVAAEDPEFEYEVVMDEYGPTAILKGNAYVVCVDHTRYNAEEIIFSDTEEECKKYISNYNYDEDCRLGLYSYKMYKTGNDEPAKEAIMSNISQVLLEKGDNKYLDMFFMFNEEMKLEKSIPDAWGDDYSIEDDEALISKVEKLRAPLAVKAIQVVVANNITITDCQEKQLCYRVLDSSKLFYCDVAIRTKGYEVRTAHAFEGPSKIYDNFGTIVDFKTINKTTAEAEKEEVKNMKKTGLERMEELAEQLKNNQKIQDAGYIDKKSLKKLLKDEFNLGFNSRDTRENMIEVFFGMLKGERDRADEAAWNDDNTETSAQPDTKPAINSKEAVEKTKKLLVLIKDKAKANEQKEFGYTISSFMLQACILEANTGLKKLKGHVVTAEEDALTQKVYKWILGKEFVKPVIYSVHEDENVRIFMPEYTGRKDTKTKLIPYNKSAGYTAKKVTSFAVYADKIDELLDVLN